MEKDKKKNRTDDKNQPEEGAELCLKCGNELIWEEGKKICPDCDVEIDFFGEDND